MIVQAAQSTGKVVIEHQGLRKSLARLRRVGAIPYAARALERTMPSAGRAMRKAVAAEVIAYAVSDVPNIGAEVHRHAGDHLTEIRRLFAGGAVGDFDFVRVEARRRAEQRFPLEEILHSYRCGHKVILRWIRAAATSVAVSGQEQTVSAIAEFSIEYTDAISATMTAEYVEQTRRLAETEGDRRTDILNALLSGHAENEGEIAQLLKSAGYLAARQSFCVALARSTDPLEMQNAPRAQRVVEAVGAAVAPLKIRAVAGLRNNVATSVFADVRRRSGWEPPRAGLVERLRPALLALGPSVLVGLSSDKPSIQLIPRALEEAKIALDCANVVDRVVRFAELSVRRLALHFGGDNLRNAAPLWADSFVQADDKSRGALSRTLRMYADSDMNAIQAARALNVHPNTLYARMRHIQALTGLLAQRYHDLTELLLVTDLLRRS